VACPSKKMAKPKYLEGTVDVDKLTEIENKFERFRQQVLGHFSNKEQVEKEPDMGEPEQEFIITSIFKNRPNEFWTYMEFFSPGLISSPIDQKIEQYRRIHRDTFVMEVYYLKNPKKYINEWKKDVPFEGLSIKNDLIRDESCDLRIIPNFDKKHTFSTLPPEVTTCKIASTEGSAKYVDLFFDLSDKGYNMRFKFYTKNKIKMRETDARGIEFRRLDYKSKKYPRYDIK
jgi:hypothetical protein